MIPGLSGTLLSHEALEDHLASMAGGTLESAAVRACRRAILAWHLPARTRLGPSAGARVILDRIASPLFAALGYRVLPGTARAELHGAILETGATRAAGLIVTPWGHDAGTAWREAVRHSIAFDLPWCFVLNGAAVRAVDARRTYSRRFAAFDLAAVVDDERGFEVFWHLLRAADHGVGALDSAVAISEAHRANVREALQRGVEQALTRLGAAFSRAARSGAPRARGRRRADADGGEALTVIYRVLFLLFAEARGLVPRWHPTYRDGYTVEALAQRAASADHPRGLWEGLQAIARLAHDGCSIGSLRVPPFNGRLFSPAHSPLADRARLDDRMVREALIALTSRPAGGRRVRVLYGDLGVEQLGAIYEGVLDFRPDDRAETAPRRGERKATGSFYTPRSLTDFVVRRTLAPLVSNASSERILALRILDPAMGSGAFLVSACRFLAFAYEAALAREGAFATGDVTEAERIAFRRAVAQRCLYGVDLNPMAVQLARLSLWLTTLAADRPLTFLDHRLRTGNSLVGASVDDITRQPPAGGARRPAAALPLFEREPPGGMLGRAVDVLREIAGAPDDTLEQVRRKDAAIAALTSEGSALSRWKAVADAWCAGPFTVGQRPLFNRETFGDAADALLGRGSALPAHTLGRLLEEARARATEHRFFHWTLEFPEIFFDADGAPLGAPGFDAILTNPPWEMLRADDRSGERSGARARVGLVRFARGSGLYLQQGQGHANLYQLFLERTLSLLRPDGRLGIVLPWGFATDHGSAALRRALLDRTRLDPLVSVENRAGVFQIHRSLRFLLLSATSGGSTNALACRFGLASADQLDRIPDTGSDPEAVLVPRALIDRASGPQAAILDLRSSIDVEILADVCSRVPALGDVDGWHVRFGRELNATEDRHHFVGSDGRGEAGLPVIEGKHLSPFCVHVDSSTTRIPRRAAARLRGGAQALDRARLGYRDVASPTNRVSLIAAVIPAGVVTTHTIFCLRDAPGEDAQHFLCGILNSLAANYLVRPRITTHVSAAIVDRLPVPRPPCSSRLFREIATLARRLSHGGGARSRAALEARAALAYGLSHAQFTHVLGTFPLVPEPWRRGALQAFCDIVT